MIAKATFQTVILFEDEVRIAAKACAALDALPADCPQEEFSRAARAALDACHTALYGAHDDAAAILLTRKPSPYLAEVGQSGTGG